MQTTKLTVVLVVSVAIMLAGGCVSEQYSDLKLQNDMQSQTIAELESQLQACVLKLEKLNRQLDNAKNHNTIETEALQQRIAALRKDINDKKTIITSMQQRLLYGGLLLPVELSTMLEDFGRSSDMVTYDTDRGIVKFKSDLLFESGSANVASSAKGTIKSLSTILNSEKAEKFDVIIAGHTDKLHIGKPATRAKHPDNWYLSAHRAIEVKQILQENNVAPERMSIRGFGEYRPLVPYKPNQKKSPQNRRVEIYIVPKGA